MTRNKQHGLPASKIQIPVEAGAQGVGLERKSVFSSVPSTEDADFRVEGSNPEAVARGNRLRDAVRAAGGNKDVSTRAGIPTSTLSTYLAGGDMKLSAALALAHACGVTLEWLATGEGKKEPDGTPSAPTKAKSASPQKAGLFETVDVQTFALCIDIVENSLKLAGRHLPTLERARAFIVSYDLLKNGDAQTSRKLEE